MVFSRVHLLFYVVIGVIVLTREAQGAFFKVETDPSGNGVRIALIQNGTNPNNTSTANNTGGFETDLAAKFIFNINIFSKSESVYMKNINDNAGSEGNTNNNNNNIIFSSGNTINSSNNKTASSGIVKNNNYNDGDGSWYEDYGNDFRYEHNSRGKTRNNNNNVFPNAMNNTSNNTSSDRNTYINNNNNNNNDDDYGDYIFDEYGYGGYGGYGYGGYGIAYDLDGSHGRPSNKHVSRFKGPMDYGPGGTPNGFRGAPFGKLTLRNRLLTQSKYNNKDKNKMGQSMQKQPSQTPGLTFKNTFGRYK